MLSFAIVYVTTTNPAQAEEMADQSTDAIATSLGYAEIRGDWKMAEQFPAMLAKVTTQQMKDVFRKYTTGIHRVYLGDKTAADEAAPAFQPVV